jgi:hypothetical protein
MYARVSCFAELLLGGQQGPVMTNIAVESALPPDVRRRLCPAVNIAIHLRATPYCQCEGRIEPKGVAQKNDKSVAGAA